MHTKSHTDCYFGVIKRTYKVTYLSSLFKLAHIFESFSIVGVNKAHLVNTHEGRIIVPVYDWVFFSGNVLEKDPEYKELPPFPIFKG